MTTSSVFNRSAHAACGLGLVLCLLGLGGCKDRKNSDTSDTASNTPADFQLGPTVQCENPVTGMDRFREEGQDRGLTEILPSVESVYGREIAGLGGHLVVADLDNDDDVDILAGGLDGLPSVYENDGTGHFTLRTDSLDIRAQSTWGMPALAAADLNGDSLPEIIAATGGYFFVNWNQGDFSFESSAEHFLGDPVDPFIYLTLSMGDLDGDGLLDLVLPSASRSSDDPQPGPELQYGGPDHILLQNARHEFILVEDLYSAGNGSRSQLAIVTDPDADGDMDVFIPADQGPPSAFWRNEGVASNSKPQLENKAEILGMALEMAAMGIDNADLNADGFLDYCISDVGPPKCLLSDGNGGFYESGVALGLVVDEPVTEPEPFAAEFTTIGWSIDFVDLDNDGILDVVQASGPDPGAHSRGVLNFPDVVWHGLASGQFEDLSAEIGFGDIANHIGMATADFDGDGFMDITVAGPMESPKLFMNQCGDGAWTRVILHGAKENTMALGALVTAYVDGVPLPREVHGLRAQAQGPAQVHFGLGDTDTLDKLEVRWPDGQVSVATNVATRRTVTVTHPSAVSE